MVRACLFPARWRRANQIYPVVPHPSGNFVYAIDLRGRINSYRLKRDDGKLEPLGGSPLTIGGQTLTGAIDPQGRFL